MNHDHGPNRLIHSKSPYLQQHAYNPVDWHPWGEEALHKAKEEDKPIIVSIGYAACHWCHVMERESFEDDTLAALMNRHFVCIKVDREERPDIDQIYMEAVQLMGVNGGWPLNVFLTPDAKPFYGGTYFQPAQWGGVLKQVSHVFQDKREELNKSADDLTEGIRRSEVQRFGIQMKEEERSFSEAEIRGLYQKLSHKFDATNGGLEGAPKFPMPALSLFLLRYWQHTGEPSALKQATLTLDQMAMGGIYDQVGGGFSRYSVDDHWFAPHFEKMLYDNAQLIHLYSEAYVATANPRYRQIVVETINFLEREMRDEAGGFYAALDADSEGVEGKFYTWTAQELKSLIKEDYDLFASYYQIIDGGNWEDGVNILDAVDSVESFSKKEGLSPELMGQKLSKWHSNLLNARTARIRPGLDDKVLTSWNGLLISGLCRAYQAFGEERFLLVATELATFIERELGEEGILLHSYQRGEAHLQGYLEDYATVIQGYIALYQSCFDEAWLTRAKNYAIYVIEHFYDQEEGLFFFTDDTGEALIARKKEIFDSVIPSSNAIMAHNLHWLGHLLDWEKGTALSKKMLAQLRPMLQTEPQYLTYWSSLQIDAANPPVELCIVGGEAQIVAQQIFASKYQPNMVIAGTNAYSDLPLLKNRQVIDGQTTIYVCRNKSCQLPVHTIEEALAQIDA